MQSNAMHSNVEQPEEGIWLERLVDGELNQDEYRTVVASLDERPAGWKQCALAFLEAQALARELGDFEQEGFRGGSGGPPPAAVTLARSAAAEKDLAEAGGARMSPWGMLGIAASFLAALGIGLWMGNGRDGGGRGVATQASLFSGFARGLDPAPRPAFELAGAECNRHLVNRVTLVVEGPDEKEQLIDLPVYQAGEDPSPYLSTDRSAMPPEVQDALRAAGHRVERRRQYVTVRLPDGREMIVPIEDVEIVPVKQVYQ